MNNVRAVVSANVLFATMGLGLASPIVQAADQGTQVTWNRIVGIVAPDSIVGRASGGGDCNVGVACIAGTPAPWPSCTSEPDDIAFLIRIAKSEPSFLVDRWNAFGAVRAITQSSVN